MGCVAFAALACAEELKAETNVETDAKAKPFVSPFMGGMYPGMGYGGYGMGGGYGGAGYGMGGMGMGGIWQYAPYLFAGYFDPYLFNAIFTPNMMYGNTMLLWALEHLNHLGLTSSVLKHDMDSFEYESQ